MEAHPLHDSSNTAAEKYRVLLEITNPLVLNLDRDALFKAIASEIRNVTTFDRAGITLYDPVADHFQIYSLETTAPPVSLQRGADIPREGSGMGWTFDHRTPLYRPQLPDDRGFFEDTHFLAEGLQSVLYLPLMTRDRILGTLQVASTIPSRYTDEDIAFLLQVARQLALALDNAPRSPQGWWKVNCSVTRRGPSPERSIRKSADLSWPIRERSSWTK